MRNQISRRNFVKTIGSSAIGLPVLGSSLVDCGGKIKDVISIDAVVNTFSKFKEFSISSISPKGWLERFLKAQCDGMTGHLDEIGYPFNTVSWAGEKVAPAKERWARPDKVQYWSDWWPYEQTGYWIDGMIRTGYLLNDKTMLRKAYTYIDYALANVSSEGVIGPKHVDFRWPHAAFFRAWMAAYSATGDKKLIEALKRHYRATGVEPYQKNDNSLSAHNLEELCWLYGMTGEDWILQNAIEIYKVQRGPGISTNLAELLSDKKEDMHGVCFHEALLLPITLYIHTGEEKLLEAARNGFSKLERDHMLIDGVPSSYEFLSGKIPRMAHETCNVATYTWTAGYMLMATGEAAWADKIERACFNAGIGSVTKDFKAHQYFSSPNQVIATRNSSYNLLKDYGNSSMSYSPGHFVECCTGNVNRFMPNYAARMWLSDGADGIVAALYGPSTIQARVGKNKEIVTVVQKTDYPFSEKIEFEISMPGKIRFPLWVRIPNWCKNPTLLINGRPSDLDLVPNSFVKIDRMFSPHDHVELTLPMELKLTHWPQNGIGIERGPLVYSLLIEENRKIVKDVLNTNAEFPAWDIQPASPWNYALLIDETNLAKDIKIIQAPVTKDLWQPDSAPVQLQVPAVRIDGWTLDHGKDEISGLEYVTTPHLPEEILAANKNVEKVTLVPYGSTCLRLTVFPQYRI